MLKYQEIETLGKCLQDNSSLILCQQKDTDKYFMMKKITLFSNDQSQEILLSQAKILKQLNHPHILKYHDILLEEDYLIQVLQFCQYGTITNYLDKRKQRNQYLSEKLIISWVMQILMALQYLNQKHIVHRLLNADNVYMNHQGDLKIGSFGKAKQLQNTLQKAQTIVGQPCNLSPQMVQGLQYDSKSDIWSLGCLIYYLATFQTPFKYGNLLKLYDSIVKQPCPELPLKYSKYLSPLYKKMMKKNPSARSSASQLLQEEVFTQLMKQYLKKKKIDSIDLKKVEPKPLIVQKTINLEKKTNKVRLEPILGSSRISTKSNESKEKQTQDFDKKTNVSSARNQHQSQITQIGQTQPYANNKLILPSITKNSSQFLTQTLKIKNSIEGKQKPKSKQTSKINRPAQKSKADSKQINISNQIGKYKELDKKIESNIQKPYIINPSIQQKEKEKEYIELLYKVKLEFLEQKYSPNMSKILQQTTEFQSFKDLLIGQ